MSRQSIADYLDRLQLEYIVISLRKRIYTKPRDQRYFEKVLAGKKRNIVDISDRNLLPHIFNDKVVRKSYEDKVFSPIGFPNFHYDKMREAQAEEFQVKDHKYYYGEGCDVRVNANKGVRVAKLKSVTKDTAVVSNNDGTLSEHPIENVTRIL